MSVLSVQKFRKSDVYYLNKQCKYTCKTITLNDELIFKEKKYGVQVDFLVFSKRD